MPLYNNLYLKGNILLTIFKKYLVHKDINLFDFFDGILDNLIEKNIVSFSKKLKNGEIKFPPQLYLEAIYESIKRSFLERKLNELVPNASSLTYEELEKKKKDILNQ